MHSRRGGQIPLLLTAVFGILLLLLGAAILLGIMTVVSRRLGVSELVAVLALWGSLLGSWVNIPVARIHSAAPEPVWQVRFLGVTYLVRPVAPPHETILAVNVGGAVLPAVLSVVLLVRAGVWWQAAVAIAAVTLAAYLTARIVPGVGIVMPIWVSPVVAAGCAVLLDSGSPAAVAYAAGALGTLIGGDLLHLRGVGRMGATVASIGGAGTFDGIFLAGLVAVLLAAV